MKLKPTIIAGAIGLIFIGGLSLSTYLEDKGSEEEKQEDRESEEKLLLEDPTSISGNSNFLELSTIYGIDLKTLTDAFLLGDVDPALFETRDLEHYYQNIDETIEIGNEAVQAFIAIHNDLDFEYIDIYLPQEAIDILKSLGKLSPAEEAYFLDHTVSNIEVDITDVELEVEKENTLTGNTTLQDLINMGLTQEALESLTGIAIDNTQILLRDYAEDNDLSYGEIKSDVELLLSNLDQ
jgi:hypothetical protein